MRGETTRTTLPVLKAAFLAGLLTTTAVIPADALAVSTSLPTTPTQNAVSPRQALMATVASKALLQIAQARADLHKADSQAATRELDRVSTLFDIVDASLPTTIAKDRIRAAIVHLGYESRAEVLPALTRIDSALNTLAAYMPVEEAKKDVESARIRLSNDKAGAIAELERAAARLAYTEVDLPLRTTRQQVAAARAAMKNGKLEAADRALKVAEDNVVFLSVAIHDPVTEAHRSLWKAVRDNGMGAYDAAKADVARAIRYLDYLSEGSDAKVDAAARSIAQQAQSVESSIGTKSGSVEMQLTALWRRTKALSDRSVEYFTTGWQRAGRQSTYSADLIEAKFHLTNAEIDRHADAGNAQVKKELAQTEHYLKRAEQGARQDYAKEIAALSARVKNFVADETPDKESAQYAALRAQLDKLIENL